MRPPIFTHIRSVAHDTYRIFVDSRSYFAAAALAYFALLSLIPFFILAASVIGFLFADVDSTQAFGVVAQSIEQFLPFLQGELEQRLLELVEARNITGLIGVGSLVAAAAFFFLTVEQAFAAIFPGSAVRGFWHSKGLAMALIPLVVGLLGFLHFAFVLVDTVIGLLSVPMLERLVASAVIDQAVSTAILAFEFWLVVYWFERERVQFRSIAVGAAVFCGLWLFARVGFTFYVQQIVSFSIVYGSLGALMVLVLWVYYASLVFLVGCCVTEAVQRR